MPQQIYDFHKIFSKENLTDQTKKQFISDLIINESFQGFFNNQKITHKPDGIVLDYNVNEVKDQLGIIGGTTSSDEIEFKRNGFNAIDKKIN